MKSFLVVMSVCLSTVIPVAGRAETWVLGPLVEAVTRHPVVVTQQNTWRRARVRIGEVSVAGAPTLGFRTQGKFPIVAEADEASTRVSDIDREYMDGVFTLSQSLFDAGQVEHATDAERARADAEALRYRAVFESQLATLVSDALSVSEAAERIEIIDAQLVALDWGIEATKRRFQGGLGTLEEIRTLELVRLDVVRDREEALLSAELAERRIAQAYQVNRDALSPAVSAIVERLSTQDLQGLSIDDSAVAEIYRLQAMAIEAETRSIEAERWPQVDASVVGVAYDLFGRGGEEYEVYGGLNVNLPLFDGGSIASRLDGLAVDASISQSEFVEEAERMRDRFAAAEARLTQLAESQTRTDRRLVELEQQMDALRQQLTTVKSTVVDLALAESQWFEALREASGYQWEMRGLRVSLADASDTLLSALGITPQLK